MKRRCIYLAGSVMGTATATHSISIMQAAGVDSPLVTHCLMSLLMRAQYVLVMTRAHCGTPVPNCGGLYSLNVSILWCCLRNSVMPLFVIGRCAPADIHSLEKQGVRVLSSLIRENSQSFFSLAPLLFETVVFPDLSVLSSLAATGISRSRSISASISASGCAH